MAYLGRAWVLQVLANGTWLTAGGIQTSDVSVGNTIVDTTSTKSGGWRQILADCGNQTVTMSGAGVFKNQLADQYLMQWAFDHSLNTMRMIQVDDGSAFSGLFMVSKLQYTGAYNGAKMYNVTLESSGGIAQEYTP